ncbi:MAG: FhaA domain-containing protein [Anaerolineae bacterium]
MNALDLLEKLAERLIEEPFVRLFKPRLHPADLAKSLAGAMEAGQMSDGRGGTLAPNHYRVALNDDDFQALQTGADITAEVDAVKRYLTALVAETGSTLPGSLRVSIDPRPDIKPGRINVVAEHWPAGPDELSAPAEAADTKRLPKSSLPAAAQWQLRLPNRTVTLGMPVVRVGRGLNNDVIVADPTVSRYHAQLRWRHGAYHVQNLSRSQPLTLNRTPVEGSAPLKPGDRLQLGQVTLQIEQRL